MTRQQAIDAATQRWGKRAGVKREKPGSMIAAGGPHKGKLVCMTCCKPDCTARWSYLVGRVLYLGGSPFAFTVEGQGHSWGDAFAKTPTPEPPKDDPR